MRDMKNGVAASVKYVMKQCGVESDWFIVIDRRNVRSRRYFAAPGDSFPSVSPLFTELMLLLSNQKRARFARKDYFH